MSTVLLGWWDQLWPNLVANIIWMTPALILHHKILKKRLAEEVELARQEFREHTTALAEFSRDVIKKASDICEG